MFTYDIDTSIDIAADHGEHFAGVILPLLKGTLKNASELYRAMNEALKRRVEEQANSAPGSDKI